MTRRCNMWAQVALPTLFMGCMPGDAALSHARDESHVLSLSILDAQGVPWPAQGTPRMPTLRLALSQPLSRPERRVFLSRDLPSDALLADLLDPPLRKDSQAQLVALTLESAGAALDATPLGILEPEARYTLVVTDDPAAPFMATFAVSASPSAGARLVESFPGDQAHGIAPNLQALLFRFDGALGPIPAGAVSLVAGSGIELAVDVEVTSCRDAGLPAGDCLWLEPQKALAPATRFEAHLAQLSDSTGAELPDATLAFVTGSQNDLEAPRPKALPCALDELALPDLGCALTLDQRISLRLALDEAALVTLEGPERLGAIAVAEEIALSISGLAPNANVPLLLTLRDLAGNARKLPFTLRTREPLASVAIDEVRADPVGREPQQEYVELLNFGDQPIELKGFTLTDDAHERGVTLDQSFQLAPGERALVVGPGFDPNDTSDGLLPKGVRRVSAAQPLSLRNTGVSLFLRDALGHRVSSAPALAPARAGACIARRSDDMRTGEPQSFAADPAQTCSPGRPTAWP